MTTYLPGTEVQARGLRWQVVLTQPLGAQTLIRLRGVEGALHGHEMDFLHPFEQIEPIVHDLRPEKAGPLRNWLVYHQAFLLEQALGADALLAVQPGRLRIEPYQLAPVLRAIRMSRPRLLLADGVGLGKTIQAGLILTELVARRIAHRILVVSPTGPLLQQWKEEMRERFGLRLQIIDRAYLEEMRRQNELGANPFDHIPLGLASIDFLKQEKVLEQLERSNYDVIVIDEAHHCMDLGNAAEREDSQRRRLAQVLARRCDAFLLLTATPHDGHDRSFASLCELLDPSLVDGSGNLRGLRYREMVIRRLKRHIVDPVTKAPLFRQRVVTPVAVTANESEHPAYMEMQRALLALIAPELRRAFRRRRYSDVLSFISLLKRSVSTVDACRSTLAVVAERFQRLLTGDAEDQESQRQRLRTLQDYRRRLERFGTMSAEEEEEHNRLEIEDLAQRLAEVQREVRRGSYQLKQQADVVAALDDLVMLAENATDEDPKIHRLIELIDEIRATEPRASILVYTEYVTSQQAIARAFAGRMGGEILTMSGEDGEAERIAMTDRFRSQDHLILISTDTAAEGLNLQERCHHLIHMELPFNPNRLEQRNGRIDRYGQSRDPIVHYLYLRNTFEERILLRLIAKFERQRALLTFVPNTLGLTTSTDAAAERLLAGLVDEDERLFQAQEPLFDFQNQEESEGASEATRELLEEIDRSLKGYREAAKTNSWLGDAGLNAGDSFVRDADAARARGDRVGAVDLARFVVDAIYLDGGDVRGEADDDLFRLSLPNHWTHGLADLPGYDPDARQLSLTTRIHVTRDAQGHQVGFLGRAHPIVRRALDRVRNLAYSSSQTHGLDTRVSAVTAPVQQPTLLCTYLGRISSGAGRELERVLAVSADANGVAGFYAEAADWLPLAAPAHAINPQGLWETHFAAWASDALTQAQQAAAAGFDQLAKDFLAERRKVLDREADELEQWLAQRSVDVSGNAAPEAVQAELFAAAEGNSDGATAAWITETDPEKRLAGFANDKAQQPARRSEAEGALRIYRQRRQEVAERAALQKPEIVPLGLLMLKPVPENC